MNQLDIQERSLIWVLVYSLAFTKIAQEMGPQVSMIGGFKEVARMANALADEAVKNAELWKGI